MEKQRISIMGNTLEVTDDTFDSEIVNSTILTVVDFWATWCGPCKMIDHIIDELADEYKGKAKIAKMDVVNNKATPARYGVRNLPTLLFFKGGEVVNTMVGAYQKTKLKEQVEKFL